MKCAQRTELLAVVRGRLGRDADADDAAAVKTAGYKLLDCGVTTSYTGEPSYVPFAQKFKQCGAKMIYLPTPGPLTNNLITAIHRVGLDPIYVMQANGYTADFAKWNTAGFGNKVYVMSAFEPLENANAVPAVQQYVDANMPSKCGLILKLDGTKWVQDFPSETGTFDCNDEYAVKTPEATWGTTLNSDRLATKFLTGDIIKPQS